MRATIRIAINKPISAQWSNAVSENRAGLQRKIKAPAIFNRSCAR